MKNGLPSPFRERQAVNSSTLTFSGFALTRRKRRGVMGLEGLSAAQLAGALPGAGGTRLQPMTHPLFRRLIRAFFPFIAPCYYMRDAKNCQSPGAKPLLSSRSESNSE